MAACARHLGIRASYAGYVHYDDAVWRSVRQRRLFMVDSPGRLPATEVARLTRSLMRGESLPLAW